jgi:hypothetical protein
MWYLEGMVGAPLIFQEDRSLAEHKDHALRA